MVAAHLGSVRCARAPVVELLLIGAAIALAPVSVIAFIIVLSTAQGMRNGAAFIAGWVVSLVAVIGLAAAATGGTPIRSGTGPSTAASTASIALGLFLAVYGLRRLKRRAVAQSAQPKWAARLDRMGPGGSAVLGVMIQPWPLVAAGGLTIVHADLSNASTIIGLALFVLLATSALASMEVYSLRNTETAREKLDDLRAWIDRHRDRGLSVVAAAIGAYLIVKGVVALT
jgi:hypothetical protein